SSRRRHTRFSRDWSSDVCSSDLIETAIKSLRHGVDGLLLKPFNNTDLLETVQAALENVKARREATRLRALRPLFLVNESLFSERSEERRVGKGWSAR